MKPDEIDLQAMPQRCGTCEHPHSGTVRLADITPPPCTTCGCAVFTMHPDERAEVDAAEAAQAPYVGATPILGPSISYSLGQVLAQFEADVAAHGGWDLRPAFGAVHLGPRTAPAHEGEAALMPIIVAPAEVPDKFWAQGDQDPARIIEALAGKAERSPSWFDAFLSASNINPTDPAVAWWCMVEAYVRNPDDLGLGSVRGGTRKAVDEVRMLFCADVDNRIYTLTRERSTEAVSIDVSPAVVLRQEIADVGFPEFARSVEGLPPLAAAMLHLVRTTRGDMALREALRQGP